MSKNIKKSIKRRDFIKSTALVVGCSFALPRFSIAQSGGSANSKVNIAMIGSGGIASMAYGPSRKENLVALCDVDEKMFGAHVQTFPTIKSARTFSDFRVMLDKMGKEIDAVCINTPDHTHFVATMDCMQRGKHVITQKPLTHNIWQARTLRRAAEKYKVVTNMGNQGHTFDGIRQMKEWVEAGLLGQVTEIHAGIDGPNWKGPYFRKPKQLPLPAEPVPAGFNWDLWQGPVAESAYRHYYHPRWWRGFWKFGGGTLGDWFCHIGDGPVWVLDLYEPTVIECVERNVNELGDSMCPNSAVIRWDFPARGTLAPCSLYWSDGLGNGGTKIKIPGDWNWASEDDDDATKMIPTPAKQIGSYWTGSKANAYLDARSDHPKLTSMTKHQELMASGKLPGEKYRRVKGGPHQEWIDAIKGLIPETGSNFEFASRLTEIDLLGVLAQRFGGRIEWDAANMKITNRPELNAYLKEPVRKGWEYGEDLWKS